MNFPRIMNTIAASCLVFIIVAGIILFAPRTLLIPQAQGVTVPTIEETTQPSDPSTVSLINDKVNQVLQSGEKQWIKIDGASEDDYKAYYTNEVLYAEKILSGLDISEDETQKDTVKKIIQYIVANKEYPDEERAKDKDVSFASSFFKSDKVNCSGYAESFYALCTSAGIDCDIILCYVDAGDGPVYHAFNSCTLDDGNVYYFDLTMADSSVLGRATYNPKYVFSKTIWNDRSGIKQI